MVTPEIRAARVKRKPNLLQSLDTYLERRLAALIELNLTPDLIPPCLNRRRTRQEQPAYEQTHCSSNKKTHLTPLYLPVRITMPPTMARTHNPP
jgi:hypothetical protein